MSYEDPFQKFRSWFNEAEQSEPNDPNAMALATCTPQGIPSVRMVLLKGVDEKGFVFYTNYESRKGQELLANPHAALCLHWKSLRRQVRIEGAIEQVSAAEADEYFASRPRSSRIGAWASQQSREMQDRLHLERRVAEFTAKFGLGEVPRPPFWSGFRVLPNHIEFWQDKPFRLHERIVYEQDDTQGWRVSRLFP